MYLILIGLVGGLAIKDSFEKFKDAFGTDAVSSQRISCKIFFS